MQMLYNSDNFAVVAFELPSHDAAAPQLTRGGFEIVDKAARKEIYLEGAAAEGFQLGVQALVEQGPTQEALDDFISGYTQLAQQPLRMH